MRLSVRRFGHVGRPVVSVLHRPVVAVLHLAEQAAHEKSPAAGMRRGEGVAGLRLRIVTLKAVLGNPLFGKLHDDV